jgi:hypothetical protein
MGFEFLLGGGASVILFALGFFTGGGAAGTSGITIASPPGPGASCSVLCAFWNTTRLTACMSAAAAATAATALAAARAMLTSAMLVALSLLTAAIATSFIPFIGPALAASLLAAYAVAQAYVLFLLGRLTAAASAASATASTASTDLITVARARAAVISGCTEPALTACLTTPSPCPAVP